MHARGATLRSFSFRSGLSSGRGNNFLLLSRGAHTPRLSAQEEGLSHLPGRLARHCFGRLCNACLLGSCLEVI